MQHINSFNGGMKKGIDYSLFPQNSYLSMKNGTMMKNDERGLIIQNIKSNKNTNYQLGATEYPIASTSFNDIMYFLTYNTGSQLLKLYYKLGETIYELKNMDNGGTATAFTVHRVLFGFTNNKLVEMIAKESYDGSTDLYLCDGLNPNIIINTGIDKDGVYTSRKYPVNPDKNLFTHQKSFNKVPVVSSAIHTNGNLKPGCYYFYVRYEDESLNPTPFIKEYGPIFIHSKDSGAINKGEFMNKRIVLNISNLDTNYKFISIGVVYLFGENGILSRENYIIDKQYTISPVINVIFDGNNVVRHLVIEELVKDNIKHNICESATQIDGVYYGANWKGTKENNEYLKELASYIMPRAVLKATSNFDKVYDEENRENEYVENDFYPIGVSFIIDGRYKTDVFPICGWSEGKPLDISIGTYSEPTYAQLTTASIVTPGHWDVIFHVNELLPNYFYIEITGTTVSVKFQYQITRNVIVGFKIYHNDGINFDEFTAEIIPDVDNNYGTSFMDVHEMTATATSDLEMRRVTSFDAENDGYKVNDLGNPDISGSYWKDSVRYFIYEDGNYPPIPDMFVNMWDNRVYTPPVYSQALDASNYKTVIPEISNNSYGLYSFPDKYKLVPGSEEIDVHFRLLGFEVDYRWAKQFISDYVGSKPEITGFYIMQGKRQKNFLTQGYSVAAVEAVGFEHEYNTVKAYPNTNPSTLVVGQTTKLGTSIYDAAFPLLDGSNFRMFPVLRISRSYNNASYVDTYASRVWRIEANAISQLNVCDKDEYLLPSVYKNDVTKKYYKDISSFNNVFNNKFKEVKTDRFCIYSPDILLDRSLIINSDVFVKPVISLHDKTTRANSFTFNDSLTEEKHYNSFESAITYPTFFNYKDEFNRILNPILSDYNKVTFFNDIRQVMSSIVNENTIYDSINGFSTRMKSIIEVYGDDYKQLEDDQSSTITSYFAQSRNQAFNAGILLNRTKKTVSDTNNLEPVYRHDGMDSADTTQWNNYPFGNQRAIPFISDDNENALPLVVSNLSMKSLPYIGCKLSEEGKYLTNATLTGFNDYRGLHNCIVNIYLYETFEDYKNSILNSFNPNFENYSFVYEDVFTSSQSNAIYKGDLFSQKTFMRCIKWSHLPERKEYQVFGEKYDNSYSWKYGTSFNLYLQSTTNSYLRVPEYDKTFYPFVMNEGLGTESETMDIFTWKSEKENMLKESWTYNDGYHQLLGIFKLPAFDELLSKQSFNSNNRIRFSLKHVSGALVDAYRELLIDNFHDFAFENGEIVKLIKYNNSLFSIQKNGILQHYQSQRLEATGDSSEIILGDKSVISDSYRQIAEVGTQHKESVVAGDNGIYGIDWNRECIWRIKPNATQTGGIYFGYEELNVSKQLFSFIKDIKNSYNTNLKQDLYGSPRQGIIAVYDEKRKEILFTIHYGYVNNGNVLNYNTTLVFSELFDTFVAEYTFDNNMFLKHGNKLLSFKSGVRYIQEQYEGYTNQTPFELEFIVNCKTDSENDASLFEKEFKAHIMDMCPEELDYILWETKYQYSNKSPFKNPTEFWSNPEYREHTWRIPIIPNKNTSNTGPNGTAKFKSFEQNSQLKGQWLKVKISYSGSQIFYIKNIITNFIISY